MVESSNTRRQAAQRASMLAAVTGALPGRPYDPKKSTMRKHMWRASMEQAEYWARQGMITEYEFRAYKLAATWCSPRFGGAGRGSRHWEALEMRIDAAISQDRYFRIVGMDALRRRRERATSLWFKFCFEGHI